MPMKGEPARPSLAGTLYFMHVPPDQARPANADLLRGVVDFIELDAFMGDPVGAALVHLFPGLAAPSHRREMAFGRAKVLDPHDLGWFNVGDEHRLDVPLTLRLLDRIAKPPPAPKRKLAEEFGVHHQDLDRCIAYLEAARLIRRVPQTSGQPTSKVYETYPGAFDWVHDSVRRASAHERAVALLANPCTGMRLHLLLRAVREAAAQKADPIDVGIAIQVLGSDFLLHIDRMAPYNSRKVTREEALELRRIREASRPSNDPIARDKLSRGESGK